MSQGEVSDRNIRRWVRAGLVTTVHSVMVGNVTLDLHSGLASVRNEMIALRPQENLLLGLLSETPRRVVHYPVLFDALYGPRTCREAARVRLKALVAGLRKRLGDDLREHLCTAPGFGLVLYTRVEEDPVRFDSQGIDGNLSNVRKSCA